MKYNTLIAVPALIIFLTGCEREIITGNRSGTIEDDYIEGPVSAFSKKYKNALDTSNKIIEKIIKKEYEAIHSEHIHDEMKGILSIEVLRNDYEKVKNTVGPIKNYKKMQWGFLPTEENGKELLFSFKIVEHKKTILNYAFVFENDGVYKKLLGVQVYERNGPRFSSQFK